MRIVLLILTLLAGCSRSGYEQLRLMVDAAPTPDKRVAVEAGREVSVVRDMDSGRDMPIRRLACEAPTLVAPAFHGLNEPGVRVDGLELWASVIEKTFRARRDTLDADFGEWSEVQTGGLFRNPDFFSWGGVEYVMMNRDLRPGGERIISLCTLDPIDCQPVKFFDPLSGEELTRDADGPSVATGAGSLVMLLNNSADRYEGDVYLARPQGTSLELWSAAPILPFYNPAVHEDDPALTPDGLTMVVAVVGPDGVSNLWVAHRGPGELAFSRSRELSEVNSPESDSSPVFFVSPDGRVELFFNSARSGTPAIYRAVCLL